MILWYCHRCGIKFVGTVMTEWCDCGNTNFRKEENGRELKHIELVATNDIGYDDGVLWAIDEEKFG